MCLYCTKEIPREKHNLLIDDNNTTIFHIPPFQSLSELFEFIPTAMSSANDKKENISISWFKV